MRRAAGLLVPIVVILVPSMVPAVAVEQSAANASSAVPREAMTLLLAGPENLVARPFDLRVGAVPPDFPVDVLPAGAAVQVSAGSDRVLAAVAALPRFGPDDRSALEARLDAAGWINPLQPAGFSLPEARAAVMVCRGDRFATILFAPRSEGGTWLRAAIVTDPSRPCVVRPRAQTASQVPLPALTPPAGARGGHASLGGTPGAMYSSVRLETRQSVAEVAAHYATQLTAAGWTIDGRSSEAATMAVTRLRTAGASGERITGLLVVTALDAVNEMDVLFRILQPAGQ